MTRRNPFLGGVLLGCSLGVLLANFLPSLLLPDTPIDTLDRSWLSFLAWMYRLVLLVPPAAFVVWWLMSRRRPTA